MSKIPTVRLVFDVKKRASKKTKGLVQVVVTLDRKRQYYSTGIKLFADQWSEKGQVINSPQSIESNAILNTMLRKAQDYIRQCMENSEPFTFEEVDKLLSVGHGKQMSFLDFMEERIENRPDIADGTRRHHRVCVDALREHGVIKYMSDLTKANIIEFHEWLQRKGIAQPTVYNYMKNFKTYVHQAMERGLVANDPFVGVKTLKGKNAVRSFLTEEELHRLQEADINVSPVAKARDLFVFQCYTGMAYADMMEFSAEDIQERNGKKVIVNKRVKSDEEFYIVLLTPAQRVLEKYDYTLPTMSNQKYNEYLSVAIAHAGINKHITTHSGRHTFAVMALNNGIPMEVVAKILGHADIRTTRIYAKVLNKSVEDAFDKLEKLGV